MSDARLRIHTIIFCWRDKVSNVEKIYHQTKRHSAKVTVLDSSRDPIPDGIPEDAWIRIDEKYYFGLTFKSAIDHFDGDILLQIQGDVIHDDFGAIVALCYERFNSDPLLGVWSPDMDNTAFSTSGVEIFPTDDVNVHLVVQTDCIVWALKAPVISYLRTFDYGINNLGWGIDWAACAFCYSNRLSVVRDTAATVVHPPGSGYDHEEARRQQTVFLSQLGRPERLQYTLLSRWVFGR